MGKGNRHLNFNKMWFSNFKQIHGMSTNVNSTTIKQIKHEFYVKHERRLPDIAKRHLKYKY